MEIATVMNIHADPDVVIDTLESINMYVTNKNLVIVDGASKNIFNEVQLPAIKIEGFPHKSIKSPYRNMALGLMMLYEMYPKEDWYLYLEPDCLVGSEYFKQVLEKSDKHNVWMMGTNGHIDEAEMPLIESLLGEEFKSGYYLLGACLFFNQKFMKKLNELNFFEKFLNLTNGFTQGHMPGYGGYDISESMYPTMARHFGGNIGVLSSWSDGVWHGNHEMFPIRWRPSLDAEDFSKASIMHPIKTISHPLRVHYREKRNCCKNKEL